MAGTWLDTVGDAPNNYVPVRMVRAYEGGVQQRMASSAPVDNPHPAGTPENVLHATGYTDAANGTIDPSSAYRGQIGPA